VAGYSSGGKYALACAHALPDRVEAAGVVAGVGPPDTPRFREGLSRNDRLTMTLGTRARPLALAYWRLARAMVNRRPASFIAEFEKQVSEADRAALADPEVRSMVVATTQEALRPRRPRAGTGHRDPGPALGLPARRGRCSHAPLAR
jgi:pimeloyl-ACP methyl ester carboxylesterase